MKRLHLICNAHLDPIWQWEWQEGASAALATFSSAADLAEEFDYIFCHNEVMLYKYIEESAPTLFERIKKLVSAGKWRIMGGWYLQPDCNMASGESLVRQILVGKKYFLEKFGVFPEIAIGFDTFGHCGGLPQIINKCGQKGYIAVRPFKWQLALDDDYFLWVGADGTEIKTVRCETYATPLGKAGKSIEDHIRSDEKHEVGIKLWGVGNHGGGPSRKDLKDIEQLIKGRQGELEILHSTPERFFEDAEFSARYEGGLNSCMPGAYTSLVGLKQIHAELEREYYLTEQMCAYASLFYDRAYPEEELEEAMEDLLNLEFHDVLSGTVIKAGERNGYLLANHALLTLERLKAGVFFAMLDGEKRAEEGEYPVFVFNPHPYELTTDIEVEFSLADQNWDEEHPTVAEVYDVSGNLLKSQMIKEESTINLDWRKKVIFEGTIKPFGITRFSVRLRAEKQKARTKSLVFEGERFRARVGTESGLLEELYFDGKAVIDRPLGRLTMWKDNADPWAMSKEQLKGVGSEPKAFTLMKKAHGVFEGMQPVQIIEDGEICLTVEAFFECENTVARTEYRFYKTMPYFDVNVDLFLQNADRLVRIDFPTCIRGKYFGQIAYGVENLYADGRECVAQRYVGVKGDSCFSVFNRGCYGSRYSDGVISMTLARGAGYCVHPIDDRPLMPTDRYIKRMDEREHNYRFRITCCKEGEIEKLSREFDTPMYALNAFPIAGKSAFTGGELTTEGDDAVSLNAFKQAVNGGYIFRLYNGSAENKRCTLKVKDSEIALQFTRYEVKTVKYADGKMSELSRMEI